jgi:hypothetical protein
MVYRLTLNVVTPSSTRTQSAATFHAEDVVAPARPTGKITIGGRTYEVRAPKFQVWWDTVRMLEGNELGGAAVERLAEEAEKLTPAEQRELLEQAAYMASFESMQVAVIYGIEDRATGHVRGGFLRQCMTRADWRVLADDIDDPESEVDLPDLYQAALTVQQLFAPWFTARADSMGLPAPQPTANTGRKTTKRKA